MSHTTLLGPWVRRFLLEYLVRERNLAINTQTSYRDMVVLLLSYASVHLKKPVDRLAVIDLSPELLLSSSLTWNRAGVAAPSPATSAWVVCMHWRDSSARTARSISSGAHKSASFRSKELLDQP